MKSALQHRRLSSSAQPLKAAGPAIRHYPIVVRLFNRRWVISTFLVVAAALVMIRLGIWQLDRLEKRRDFNARAASQLAQPVLHLNAGTATAPLADMEYRSVIVRGVYDFSNQVALRNQAWENQWGVHLLTPLRIDGADNYILVDRGWVPSENFTYDDWSLYDEPGVVEIQGVIRASQNEPDFGKRSDAVPAPGEPPLKVWNFTNVEAIARQVPYTLLPVYIQQAPNPASTSLPQRVGVDLDLSEGPHLGYAIQWFAFAAILLFGYPFFIRKQERSPKAVR